MGYVAARCPNCAGDLQLDDKMEKGYCSHCGTPIYFKDAVQKVKIEIEGFAKLDSLIMLIKKDLEYGMNQTEEFRDRLNRALELDPNNQYLYDMQSSQIWNAKIIDGKLVEYKTDAKRIVIPECVTTINTSAFKECHLLEEIVLPRSISLIMDDAFYKEENLTISTYKNTYAARFAIISPAYLHILDDDENNQVHIRKIEQILSEIVAFKSLIVSAIARHYGYNVLRSIIFWVALFISSIIWISFWLYDIYDIEVSSESVGYLGLILVVILKLVSTTPFCTYFEIRKKIATKNQIMKFYKNSNELLNPLGVKDFKYLKNIWGKSDATLEYEVKQLQKVKDKILTMDRNQFLENPNIDLSYISYILGKRPKGLDDY